MKNIIINLILLFFSLLCVFFAIETIERLRSEDNFFKFQNLISVGNNLLETAYPLKFDSKLGWSTKTIHDPHDHNIVMFGNKVLTVLNDGIRSNNMLGPQPNKPDIKSENRILAVGDSFTFGNEVRNDDTWPSYLEKYSGKPVLNGGVLGYSFGQSILRAELLHDKYQFDTLIVSIIPDDINRDTYSIAGGVPIPYWNIKDDKLILIQNHIRKVPKQNRSKKLREINI